MYFQILLHTFNPIKKQILEILFANLNITLEIFKYYFTHKACKYWVHFAYNSLRMYKNGRLLLNVHKREVTLEKGEH